MGQNDRPFQVYDPVRKCWFFFQEGRKQPEKLKEKKPGVRVRKRWWVEPSSILS